MVVTRKMHLFMSFCFLVACALADKVAKDCGHDEQCGETTQGSGGRSLLQTKQSSMQSHYEQKVLDANAGKGDVGLEGESLTSSQQFSKRGWCCMNAENTDGSTWDPYGQGCLYSANLQGRRKDFSEEDCAEICTNIEECVAYVAGTDELNPDYDYDYHNEGACQLMVPMDTKYRCWDGKCKSYNQGREEFVPTVTPGFAKFNPSDFSFQYTRHTLQDMQSSTTTGWAKREKASNPSFTWDNWVADDTNGQYGYKCVES